MKKIILIFSLSFIAVKGYSQQFSLYNTGTLYDSFENPSQRSFIPDSSRSFAFNFLVPAFNANVLLTGDAQSSLVSRSFGNKYSNSALQVGNGNYNHLNFNANAYSILFKLFASLNGDEELGFFTQTRAEGRGAFTDESVALFNGPSAFPNNIYDNIFNDHIFFQVYNSIGLSYRERLSSDFAIGFKLGLLTGIDYNKIDIYESHISFDRAKDQASISFRGRFATSQGPGKFDSRSLLPTTRSPGAQLSIGTSYKTEEGITFQGNLKDVGFIHWYSNSSTNDFNNTRKVGGLSGNKREDSVYNATHRLLASAPRYGSFTSYTDGRFELSASKSYYLDVNNNFRYTPTLIASKELFYNGFTGALVNRIQYKKYNASLTASYDNQNLFNVGLQFLFKSSNAEFYIGSERVIQSIGLASAKSNPFAYTNAAYTGADFYLGFSLKFGQLVEHPLNASLIPNGEKGFLARLYNRLFKTYH